MLAIWRYKQLNGGPCGLAFAQLLLAGRLPDVDDTPTALIYDRCFMTPTPPLTGAPLRDIA
jgi:hypothetical protein